MGGSSCALLLFQRTLRSFCSGAIRCAVIIQMFDSEWDWDSVAAECKFVIGSAGYGFVQGSIIKLIITRVDS